MPKSHQRHLEWSPTRIVAWASTIGPETTALVESILTSRPRERVRAGRIISELARPNSTLIEPCG